MSAKHMRMAWVVVLLSACGAEPIESESVSALVDDQGTDYQGTDYQGTDYQGTDYQGTDYQGTDYQGTDYQGTAYGSVLVTGTSVIAWKQLVDLTWEQRFPDRVCRWDATKTVPLGCTIYDLSISASPLAGAKFTAQFRRPNSRIPLTGTIRIGHRANQIGAVTSDTSLAMHPLAGTPAASCQASTESCSSTRGCRRNCDLFTYELWLLTADGEELPFCSGGARAYALPGTWSATGQYAATNNMFTFACGAGTIAKCTRWGYRPWTTATATKSDGTTAYTAEYHQACVRAATADYCANGHSFTMNGTLVDIYDYGGETQAVLPAAGFIPRTSTNGLTNTVLLWESTFDRYGAGYFDHFRYEEMLADIENATVGCPGRFHGIYGNPSNYFRTSAIPLQDIRVAVSNSTSCRHSEQTVGKFLDVRCNTGCIGAVAQSRSYCADPFDARGWDQGCVDAAALVCKNGTSTAPMAYHSECTTGIGLAKWDSACTLSVCTQSPGCCTGSYNPLWTSSCVNLANAICKGGRGVHTHDGFCTSIAAPPGNGT